MQIDRRTASCALLLGSLGLAGCAAADTAPPGNESRSLSAGDRDFVRDLDAFIAATLARFPTVPALSVAVARGAGPVYAKAHGRADIEAGIAATADTRFYIASSTKSFVGLTFALLDARGTIDLDWALAELAPDVAFAPALRAGEVTLRHLLSHTHGLEGRPIEFRLAYTGEHDAATLWRLLGRLTPNAQAPLGTFRYGNLGFNVAALLVERRLGRSWHDLVEREVLAPLALRETVTRGVAALRARRLLAAPYLSGTPGGTERLYLEKQDDMMQSAGGMFSTAGDMARWISVNLAAARGGRTPVPAAAVAATHRPIGTLDDDFEMFRRTGYGLGWYSGPYQGGTLYHSFGGFTGARSHVSFLPDRDVGVAVLTNDEGIGFALADIVAAYVYDWVIGGAATAAANAAQIVDRMAARADQRRAAIAADRARRAARTSRLTLPTAAYAGRYCSDDWGTVELAQSGGGLALRWGRLRASLDPFTEENSARVEAIPGEGRVLRFAVENGAVAGIALDDRTFRRC